MVAMRHGFARLAHLHDERREVLAEGADILAERPDLLRRLGEVPRADLYARLCGQLGGEWPAPSEHAAERGAARHTGERGAAGNQRAPRTPRRAAHGPPDGAGRVRHALPRRVDAAVPVRCRGAPRGIVLWGTPR